MDSTTSILLSAADTPSSPTSLLLDTQSSIHIACNPDILSDIVHSSRCVTVQGITKNRMRVTEEGNITHIGVQAYYHPGMAANILSYSQLQLTHTCEFNTRSDTFTATPFFMGPTLTFTNVNGHYSLDLPTVLSAFSITVKALSSEYTQRQRSTAKKAYDFIARMGFVSYKAAAEVIQRGSMKDLGFTRSDLVNAQKIYGTPAAYQLGQGTHKSISTGENEPIPIHESVAQELQVDLFFMYGQAFFLSISVLLGLIMVTHLGPGSEVGRTGADISVTPNITTTKKADKKNSAQAEGSKAKAGKSLLNHIKGYIDKGFRISRVSSDGEPAIKAVSHDLLSLGIDLNVLGRGSHVPHAEAAIRLVKNRARSTRWSLPFNLPIPWIPFLITFVVHTVNMIPKVNSIGHLSAFTNFTGRVPSYLKDAPHAFGTAGFLQKAQTSNNGAPRADYCIWIGPTRNFAGTHKCVNLDTFQVLTGDTFRPAPITPAAIARINQLAGEPFADTHKFMAEPLIEDPSPPFALDPNRGVYDHLSSATEDIVPQDRSTTDIVPADSLVYDPDPYEREPEMEPEDTPATETDPEDTSATSTSFEVEAPISEGIATEDIDSREQSQAAELVAVRNIANPGYNLRSTANKNVYAALSTVEAREIYGDSATEAASIEEISTCIKKDVWECLPPTYRTRDAIPSKMFFTPKFLPDGSMKSLKSRIVGGGHRQDTSHFRDSEISSPTVALTSVMVGAALAAHEGHHVMTLDHKAAYLNAAMTGPPVEMLLTPEIARTMCALDPKYRTYVRADNKIAVRLKKALYGCVQSAMLWYKELASTLVSLGFRPNPYDTCSFVRHRQRSIDRILVYVDDLFITSDSKRELDTTAEALKSKYGQVTSKTGLEHDYLGIRWDFRVQGQATLSMEGYVKDVIRKYGVTKAFKTPAGDGLFTSDENSPALSPEKCALFLSAVMTLHYLAKRVRPDTLAAVSWCATRVLHPTEEDERKLDRILGYLLHTQDQTLILRIGEKCELRAYVDSSHGVYPDGKSVTGVVHMIGDAPVYFKASKQPIVTRSSTESELVGISDALSQILWTREFMLSQGVKIGTAILYQDNMSTIFLANRGRSTSDRTRHIKIRYFFVAHYVEANEIRIEYMPTTHMVADILTKALHGTLFQKFATALTGHGILKREVKTT